jgi:hypothetical protein
MNKQTNYICGAIVALSGAGLALQNIEPSGLVCVICGFVLIVCGVVQ